MTISPLKQVAPAIQKRTVTMPRRKANSVYRTRDHFTHAVLHVRRAKKGTPATHPVVGDEMRALRKLQREQEPKAPFVFTVRAWLAVHHSGLCALGRARWCQAAGFKFKAHPHMLRHACGFALANKGHDTRALQAYLGHRNIQHTVRYTELSPGRFKDFWR